MSRIRFLPILLALVAAAGCRAQTAAPAAQPPAQSPVDAKTARKIEVLARAKLSVPAEYQILVGQRGPSQIAGFDTIKLIFSLPDHPDRSQTLVFLISKDGQTLARLTQWSLDKDPAEMVSYAGRPVRGNPDAKVVLVNFDDLECPYCAKMHAELFPETMDRYKGLIKVVYHNLPLEELHPWAMHAAINANCLADQSSTAYWSYVDYLHLHGDDVTGPTRDLAKAKATLDTLATEQINKNKLDTAKLTACILKQDDTAIHAEIKLADSLGLASTPILFVNGEEMEGALDVSTLWKIIDRALLSEGITPPPLPGASAPAPGQGVNPDQLPSSTKVQAAKPTN